MWIDISDIINCNICDFCKCINDFIEKTFDLNKLNTLILDKINNYCLEELDFINKNYSENLNKLFKNRPKDFSTKISRFKS